MLTLIQFKRYTRCQPVSRGKHGAATLNNVCAVFVSMNAWMFLCVQRQVARFSSTWKPLSKPTETICGSTKQQHSRGSSA